jgi:hypothetical protein
MQELWVPLADVVERIVGATGDDGDFVRNELLKLLQAGTISGRVAESQLIPPHHWNEAALSKTGAAVIPFGALPIHQRHQIELRLPDVLRNWAEQAGSILAQKSNNSDKPASPDTFHKTGFPGHPSSRHLVEAEFHHRWSAGERQGSMSEWGRVLEVWLRETHPGAPKATAQTIRNHLSSSLPGNIKADL